MSSTLAITAAALEVRARKALDGVGDPSLGEWVEQGASGVLHLRRRLSAAEADGMPVVDVRGTDEASRRFRAMQRHLPPGWTEAV